MNLRPFKCVAAALLVPRNKAITTNTKVIFAAGVLLVLGHQHATGLITQTHGQHAIQLASNRRIFVTTDLDCAQVSGHLLLNAFCYLSALAQTVRLHLAQLVLLLDALALLLPDFC